MKETKCEYCGKVLKEDEVQTFQGVRMCKDCLEEKTVVCSWCNSRIWNEDNYGNGSIDLCRSCYDSHYTTCERCGGLVCYDDVMYLEDDGDPYCESCYELEQKYQVIHDYNYKPEPIFYGEDDMYMGVELEIDKGGECREAAEELINIANFPKEHMYIKHDGSIEEGFEMVTHPMSLDYHMSNMPWEKIFEKALSMDYRSHQTSTCGLHVHVDRQALGSEHTAQEEAIARIVYFVEAHWDELLKFSRRTEANIMRWASRYGIEENTKATYDKAKKGNYSRYVCVNLQNYKTVEFRIFRGTLKYETFIATLQLVHEICNKAIDSTDKEFETMTWRDFIRGINKEEKPELINYLKSKDLYIEEV